MNNERKKSFLLSKNTNEYLLAIMALNLFSITGTLKKNGKLYVHKQLCVREDALFIQNLMYKQMKFRLSNVPG